MAKISIIVPVYHTAKYLHRCIESVLAQTFTDWEMLLIDDGSTDDSAIICDEYAAKDERIRVFHKENGGVSSARNLGLDHAQGEWITFIDADDWVEPEMLAKMLAKAEESDADVVICDLRFVWHEQSSVYSSIDWNDDKTESLNRYIASSWTCMCSSMAKRSLYADHNLHSPSEITYCEDFHLMVRLCHFAKRVVHIAEPFYNYRQILSSAVHNLNPKTEADEQWAYADTIRFLKEQGAYEAFRRAMCWRMLKATQEMVLDRKRWGDFRNILPEKRQYICSCPYLNTKLKLNMWCLTHHLPIVSHLLLLARKLKHNG